MTILEQILAGLQTKFTGVDTAILTRIATKKAEGITDETKVNSIVEGISFSDAQSLSARQDALALRQFSANSYAPNAFPAGAFRRILTCCAAL